MSTGEGGPPAVGLGTLVLAAAPASTRVPARLALLVAAIRGPALAADVSPRLDGISVTATRGARDPAAADPVSHSAEVGQVWLAGEDPQQGGLHLRRDHLHSPHGGQRVQP